MRVKINVHMRESKDKVAPHAKSKNPSASILSLDEIQRKTVLSIASRTESVTKLILRNLTETTHKMIRGRCGKGLKICPNMARICGRRKAARNV